MPEHHNHVMWIDHLGLLPGDATVNVSYNANTSGVGTDLAGLVIQSTTTGDITSSGSGKVVWTALEIPPGFKVRGVRLCYEDSSPNSYISQVRLAQVQNPPATALVLLDDPTHLTSTEPVCVDSEQTGPIDPRVGPILLHLRVNFGNTADRIVVRGLGLHLVA
jgi:hypothetical protein